MIVKSLKLKLNLNGIIVTGNHKLLYNDAWIPVTHTEAQLKLKQQVKELF